MRKPMIFLALIVPPDISIGLWLFLTACTLLVGLLACGVMARAHEWIQP